MPARRFVFLSHNTADKPAVEEIARRLEAEGIEPWFDAWHLIPGEKWQPALEKALTEARASVIVVGPSGMGPWQYEEMRVVIDRRVGDPGYRVVPLLLPGAQRGKRSAVPPFLTSVTWVEFQRNLDEEVSWKRLIAGIEGRPPEATEKEQVDHDRSRHDVDGAAQEDAGQCVHVEPGRRLAQDTPTCSAGRRRLRPW